MALKAGRVGVAKSEVDEFGHITGGGVPENVYTKSQCDNKFELKSHIGGLKFRDNDGTAQYQLPNGEWTNFSSGGSSNYIYVKDVTAEGVQIPIKSGENVIIYDVILSNARRRYIPADADIVITNIGTQGTSIGRTMEGGSTTFYSCNKITNNGSVDKTITFYYVSDSSAISTNNANLGVLLNVE